MSTFTICAKIDISGILLIFSRIEKEINMDSEKVIIEIMKPLLKDYLTFTKGKLPSDWVNVRDERQDELARKQREVKELKERIKKATAYNEKAKALMSELDTLDTNLCVQLRDNVKENEEKIETYSKKLEIPEKELKEIQKELERAEAQIETRRQARIAKIKQGIHDKIRQHIEEQREGIEDQGKLDVLKKYKEISEEDIQNLASIVESQEKEEVRASKIEEVRQDLESKEEKYKDLLTEDYYLAKEEYIKELEKANIEEIKPINIITIYKKVLEQAIKEKDKARAKPIFMTVASIAAREQKMKENESVLKENDIQSQEKNAFLGIIPNIQGIKKIVNKKSITMAFAKVKETIRNMGIHMINRSLGIELLGDGKEKVVKSDEQIHEIWQKNKEKHEQLMKEIRQEKTSKEEGALSSQEILQKQLEEAKAANDVEEIDYISRMMQAASQVTVRVNTRAIPTEPEKQFVPIQQGNKPLEIPEFLKDYGARKSSYKQELNAGISQVEQRKRARLFQKKADKNKGDRQIEGIAIEGQ